MPPIVKSFAGHRPGIAPDWARGQPRRTTRSGARRELRDSVRVALYRQADSIAFNEAPMLFLFFYVWLRATLPRSGSLNRSIDGEKVSAEAHILDGGDHLVDGNRRSPGADR